ncbi:MAG: peptide ABC transporter substrate-binding protein [Actinomycetota bacterium]|nr:peptide ABC transporter substrate-binding protein [Actinomycetota bacterium]
MRHWVVAVLALAAIAASPAAGGLEQTPKRGGTVILGAGFPEPACLNVLHARCARTATLHIAEKVLEAPFEVGPDFTFRPRLVSGVTFTRQPPFTLTYRIRPEARWSDGVPITAADFVFTHQAYLSLSRKGVLNEDLTTLLERIRRVTAVDSKTVRVVLRSRFAGWRSLFGNILPRHALAGEDLETIWIDRIDNPKTGRPIGSGPFLVGRWARGEQLTLRRNPNYWGPRPAYLEQLGVRFLRAPQDRLDALREGEVDIALGIVPEVVPELRKEAGIKVLATQGAGWEHFELRVGPGGHPALTSKLVRRALAYGIDRVELVRQLYGEIGQNVRLLDSVVFLTQSRHYAPSWGGYRYRPAQARRLFEQAGCRRGSDGIYICAGTRVSLRFVTTAGVPPRARVLSMVQPQLRQVGVEVVPSFASDDALFDQIIPNGEFEIILFSWVYRPDSSGVEDVFSCGGSANFTGYCQRHVSRDLDQADRILDAEQRARALNRADRQMAKDVPVIPLYQFVLIAAHRTTLRNFAVDAFNPFRTAEDCG